MAKTKKLTRRMKEELGMTKPALSKIDRKRAREVGTLGHAMREAMAKASANG